MPTDARRIELVTRRYAELHGFRRSAIGVGMLAGALASKGVNPEGVGFFVPFAVGFGIGAVIMLWCDRFYGQRFGRVTHCVEQSKSRGWIAGGIVAASLQIDTRTAGQGLPSLTIALMGVVPAWHLVRDWPHRWYLFIEVAAAVYASALYGASVGVPHGPDAVQAHFGHYYWLAMVPMGFAAIITGWLDHLLLSKSLNGGRPAAEAHEHADTV